MQHICELSAALKNVASCNSLPAITSKRAFKVYTHSEWWQCNGLLSFCTDFTCTQWCCHTGNQIRLCSAVRASHSLCHPWLARTAIAREDSDFPPTVNLSIYLSPSLSPLPSWYSSFDPSGHAHAAHVKTLKLKLLFIILHRNIRICLVLSQSIDPFSSILFTWSLPIQSGDVQDWTWDLVYTKQMFCQFWAFSSHLFFEVVESTFILTSCVWGRLVLCGWWSKSVVWLLHQLWLHITICQALSYVNHPLFLGSCQSYWGLQYFSLPLTLTISLSQSFKKNNNA